MVFSAQNHEILYLEDNLGGDGIYVFLYVTCGWSI